MSRTTPSLTQSLSRRLGVDAGEAAFRQEILEEQALSLGRAGRRVEAALGALREHQGDAEARLGLVRDAADAVWCFLVQREVIGLRDRDQVIALYAIPREVLARLGAR
jgi:hypothetical protein